MANIEWSLSETVTEWFGPAHDLASQPLQIERTATAKLGQYDLKVFEFDRSPNDEPRRVWLKIVARNVPIVDMISASGDFEMSSMEAAKLAAVEIAQALIKAGCRPADGWWNDPNYSRFAELS